MMLLHFEFYLREGDEYLSTYSANRYETSFSESAYI